ncbi:hypothetical protein [Rhodoblastus sp.]|uniref:hypothetical protein n=1 Tax=Rhodoblastus sp. TaxID=1962975 RepID=UPI003F95A1D7
MTDGPISRFASLKEAMARILAAPVTDRIALTNKFFQELQDRDSETFSDLVRWGRDGSLLYSAIEAALGSALVRPDLTDSERRGALEDAGTFVSALKAISIGSNVLCSTDMAMELAWSALLVGLRAGLKPYEIEKLRVAKASDMGRSGGTKSAETRKAKAVFWQTWATTENQRLRSVNPTLTISERADKILASWANESFHKVGRDMLVTFIGKLDRERKAQERSASLQ